MLGAKLDNAWLDVARLAPAFLEASGRASSLDDWAGVFGIENPQRHNAVADALVTAQLFQIVLARAKHRGVLAYGDLTAAERHQRWLERITGRAL